MLSEIVFGTVSLVDLLVLVLIVVIIVLLLRKI